MLDIIAFMIYLVCLALGWPARKWYYRNIYRNTSHWRSFSRKVRSEYKDCPVRGCKKTNLTLHHKRNGYRLWFERRSDVVPLCWGHHLQVENGDPVTLENGDVVEGYKKWR